MQIKEIYRQRKGLMFSGQIVENVTGKIRPKMSLNCLKPWAMDHVTLKETYLLPTIESKIAHIQRIAYKLH